jgi:hypothetical protein
MMPPGAAAAPPTALDAAVADGAESAATGHSATPGGCGEAMSAPTAMESAGVGRGEEIGGRGADVFVPNLQTDG